MQVEKHKEHSFSGVYWSVGILVESVVMIWKCRHDNEAEKKKVGDKVYFIRKSIFKGACTVHMSINQSIM